MKYRRPASFVPSTYTLESLPLCLQKNMNWDHRSVERNDIQIEMGFRSSGGAGPGQPSRSLSLLLLPLRYAVLCGQLAEHEGIQKRIQRGFSFKVRRGSSSFPCAVHVPARPSSLQRSCCLPDLPLPLPTLVSDVSLYLHFPPQEHVDKALALQPENPLAHFLLGRWCYQVS